MCRERWRASMYGCSLLFALLMLMSGALPGCSRQNEADGPAGVYRVAITAATPADLPKCTSALRGTTAYVQTPTSLWSCTGSMWLPIPCADVLGGAVAYASSTKSIYACTAGQWTPVPLPQGSPGATGPQGPAGPAGPAGTNGSNGEDGANGKDGADGTNGKDGAESLVKVTAEPAGPNCTVAGERIDVGVDSNADGTLQTGEIQQTAYVCGGSAATPAEDAGVPPADSTETIIITDVGGAHVAPTHDFGAMAVGTLSPALTVTLSNQTTSTISSIVVTANGSTAFLLTSGTCSSLAPGASCAVSVKFGSTSSGAYTGSLVFSGGVLGGSGVFSAQVPLTGSVPTPASLTLLPASADFGAGLAGNTRQPYVFTVKNNGQSSSAPLTTVLQDTTDFALDASSDDCTGTSLAPGASCALKVLFTPPLGATAGQKTSALTVNSNFESRVSASLTGTTLVVGEISITPPAFDFGTLQRADPALTTTFVVFNTGNVTQPVQVSITPDSLDFALRGSTCGSTLPAAQSCTLELSFTANATGVQNTRIQVNLGDYAAVMGTAVP